jgi:hypothetical protein
MSERELRSSVAKASKVVKTNSKTCLRRIDSNRPYQGTAFRSPYTPLNDAVQSRSAPPLFTGSVAEPALRARWPPSWLPARLGSYRSPGVPRLRSNSAMSSTQYYLTMSNGTGGTVRPASGWRKSGASISINATPANGYSFSGWTGTAAVLTLV